MKKLKSWFRGKFPELFKEPDLEEYFRTESVTASLAMKINIGNYENMEVFSSITLKGLRHEKLSKADREKARELMYEKAWNLVGNEINVKFDHIVAKHGRSKP